MEERDKKKYYKLLIYLILELLIIECFLEDKALFFVDF